jgi:tetratricopeptide (TPR) repeat protein
MNQTLTIFFLLSLIVFSNSCDKIISKNKDLAADTTLSLITREWSKKINEFPENDEYRKARAFSLVKDGRYQYALEDIDKAIALKPAIVAYYLDKGDILFAWGKTKEALETFKSTLEKFPKNEEVLFKTAQFQLFVKEYPAAIQNFKQLLSINNARPDGYFFLGTVYKEMNDTNAALTQYLNAIVADPEYYNAYIQLGMIYSDKNDSAGIAYFTNAIRIDEFSDEAYYSRGLLYQKLGNYGAAVNDYRKTTNLNPAHKFAYYNTGNINAIIGNYQKALDQFNTAITFAPDFEKAYNRIGQILEIQGRYKEAKINYEKCLQIDPNFNLAKEGLIRVNNKYNE